MTLVARNLAVMLVAVVAAIHLSGPAAAATGGSDKHQNITQPAKKRPALRQVKRDDCSNIFRCLFSNSGRRATGSFRQVVAFNGSRYAPGTIVVRTPERALYFVLPEGEAIKYKVGVGREGFQWSGNSSIVRKEEWPSWTPPRQMIEREAAKGVTIPAFMEGGPKIRSAPALFTSAVRSFAFTAPTTRARSAARCHPVAFACSTRMWSTSTIASGWEPGSMSISSRAAGVVTAAGPSRKPPSRLACFSIEPSR